jgi:hypothetical protein
MPQSSCIRIWYVGNPVGPKPRTELGTRCPVSHKSAVAIIFSCEHTTGVSHNASLDSQRLQFFREGGVNHTNLKGTNLWFRSNKLSPAAEQRVVY